MNPNNDTGKHDQIHININHGSTRDAQLRTNVLQYVLTQLPSWVKLFEHRIHDKQIIVKAEVLDVKMPFEKPVARLNLRHDIATAGPEVAHPV